MTAQPTYLIERRLVDGGQLIDTLHVDKDERPFTLRTALDRAGQVRAAGLDTDRYVIQVVATDDNGYPTVVDEVEAARPWWQHRTDLPTDTHELASRLHELADALSGQLVQLGEVVMDVNIIPMAWGSSQDEDRVAAVDALARLLDLPTARRPEGAAASRHYEATGGEHVRVMTTLTAPAVPGEVVSPRPVQADGIGDAPASVPDGEIVSAMPTTVTTNWHDGTAWQVKTEPVAVSTERCDAIAAELNALPRLVEDRAGKVREFIVALPEFKAPAHIYAQFEITSFVLTDDTLFTEGNDGWSWSR